jgi:HK97 family phage prohead protease
MIERRFTKGAKVRAKGDDAKPGLTGYAAVFGQDYVIYDSKSFRMVERIKPGTFTRAIDEEQDVRGLFNHSADNVLARTTNSTLQLVQDTKGLAFDLDLDTRTHIAQDVRCFVDRGDVTGCSFAFSVRKQTWTETEEDGFTTYQREIEDVDLFDVGPVTYPAYDATSVSARTAAAFARELRSAPWAEGMPAEIRAKIAARADVVTGGDVPDGSGDDDQLDQECDCRCVACKRDKDCSKCSDHMVDCGDQSNCDHSRSGAGAGEVVSIDLARARTRAAELDLEPM